MYASRPGAFDDSTEHTASLFAVHAALALDKTMTVTHLPDQRCRPGQGGMQLESDTRAHGNNPRFPWGRTLHYQADMRAHAHHCLNGI